jgi:hypothetical protein
MKIAVVTSESATGAGGRGDATTRQALAHIAHRRIGIRSHAIAPRQIKPAVSNIRPSHRLVNEMGIQFFCHDGAPLLCDAPKKGRNDLAPVQHADFKSRPPLWMRAPRAFAACSRHSKMVQLGAERFRVESICIPENYKIPFS